MNSEDLEITAASINNCTVLVLIDNSSSMGVVKNALLPGLNSFFEKLTSIGVEFKYTVATFNSSLNYLCKNKSSKEFTKFEEYNTSGCTALYDSINNMIESQVLINSNNCILYVLTDGFDNASVNCDSYVIKKKIEGLKKDNNWNFILTGAEIDSDNLGNEIGIDNTKNFEKKDISEIMNEVSYSISRCISGEQSISEIKLEESLSITSEISTSNIDFELVSSPPVLNFSKSIG